MFKFGGFFGEAGADALLGGFAAADVVQPELIGAEFAFMGAMMLAKKISVHHKAKKQEKKSHEEEKQR